MFRRTTATVGRTVGLFVAVVMASLTLVVVGGASATAGAAAESSILEMVNKARVNHGLRPLQVTSRLQSIARDWSQHMAAGRCSDGDIICHNNNLSSQVNNWRAIGENVGVGGSAQQIHQMLMDSPGHRANILNSSYTVVGIGTATDNRGNLFVTQDFAQPAGDWGTAAISGDEPAKKSVRVGFRAGSGRKNWVKLSAFMRDKHHGAKVRFFRVKKNGDRVKYGVDRANRHGNAFLRHHFDHASGERFRFVSVVVPVTDRHKKTRSERDRAHID